jgi:predicted O-methyltransferase YrrM
LISAGWLFAGAALTRHVVEYEDEKKERAISTLAKQFIIRLLNYFGLEIRRIRPPVPGPMPVPEPIEELLATLDPHFRSALLSMYRGEPQLGTDGQPHPIDNISKISSAQGMWIYDLCLSVKPKSTLEIGMAYGYSTLYFLAAIARNLTGQHTAVDPFQQSYWHGIGLAHANAAGLESRFRFIEDRSDRVAADLARENSSFDLIFIDGNHRFDDVLVDFYLYAPLCAIGGRIVFDDMWMSSIQAVVAFVRANRTDFVELPAAVPNVCVFQRVGNDLRRWDHFHKFSCPG